MATMSTKELNWVSLIRIKKEKDESWDVFTARFTKLMANFRVSPNIQAIIFIKSLDLSEEHVKKLVKYVDFGNTSVADINKCVKIQCVDIKKETVTEKKEEPEIKKEPVGKNTSNDSKQKLNDKENPGPKPDICKCLSERPASATSSSKSSKRSRSKSLDKDETYRVKRIRLRHEEKDKSREEYYKKRLNDKDEYHKKQLKHQETDLRNYFKRKMSEESAKKTENSTAMKEGNDSKTEVKARTTRSRSRSRNGKEDRNTKEGKIRELKERIKWITKRNADMLQERQDKLKKKEEHCAKRLKEADEYYEKKMKKQKEKLDGELLYVEHKWEQRYHKWKLNHQEKNSSSVADVEILNKEDSGSRKL